MTEKFSILFHFVRTRWFLRFHSRAELLEWQDKKVKRFLGQIDAVGNIPIMGKDEMRRRFTELNRFGISLEEAERAALQAERERDFSLTLPGGVTVGLSSGTSGKRGVFLVTKEDRSRWAGIILARALPDRALRQVVSPWRPKLKIALFLRADSNLYQTVKGRRIDFHYFDLLDPFDSLMTRLADFQPDILIGPATVLAEIARSGVEIRPSQILSAAEVLDERDEALIAERLGVRPSQIYQATEGFIGVTCSEGRMHLNEEHLRVEEDWIDPAGGRFHPVITDFSRSGQHFVRFRLDDILVADERPCPCGRASRVIAKIEGRADEVLHFGMTVFPDAIRQALYAMEHPPENFRIEQHGGKLHLFLKHSTPELENSVQQALTPLFSKPESFVPEFVFNPWSDQPVVEKQRRIRCVTPLSYS
jgi:putative adenylate-forming enzyme